MKKQSAGSVNKHSMWALLTVCMLLALPGCYPAGVKPAASAENAVSPAVAVTDTGTVAAVDTPTPASPISDTPEPMPSDAHLPTAPQIITSAYTGYYLSGWTIENDDVFIHGNAPGGTGSETVDVFIHLSNDEVMRLTPYMCAFDNAYLSGEWLYFNYADYDNEIYEACRMNISRPEEPEFLGVDLLFATDDYLYYRRGDDDAAVYRRNGDFMDEKRVFSDIRTPWRMLPAGDSILVFGNDDFDEPGNTITLYDQEGISRYTVDVEAGMGWMKRVSGGVFYWCDSAETPNAPIRLHKMRLSDGHTEVIESTIDVDGIVMGVEDIDDTWAYIEVFIPEPQGDYDDYTTENNTYLYRIPLEGGAAEFVTSWFES